MSMARNLTLFIDSEKSLDKLASELGKCLNVNFGPTKDGAGETAFEGKLNTGERLLLMTHQFSSSGSLNLQSFRYMLDIFLPRGPSAAVWESERMNSAKGVFETLSSKTEMKLLLVDDLQHEIKRKND